MMRSHTIFRVMLVFLLGLVGLGFGSQQTSSGSVDQSSQINANPLTSLVIGSPPPGASVSRTTPGNTPNSEYVPGELLVKMRPSVSC